MVLTMLGVLQSLINGLGYISVSKSSDSSLSVVLGLSCVEEVTIVTLVYILNNAVSHQGYGFKSTCQLLRLQCFF